MLNETKIDETITNIKKSVNSIIEGMGEGDRIITKDFALRVAQETDTHIGITQGIVSLCLKNSPDGYQRSGRNGGWFKRSEKEKSN